MNPYKRLLEEVKKNTIDYGKVESLLREIRDTLSKGKIPSREELSFFLEALRTVEAKSLVTKESLEKLRLRKKVSNTYKL